MKSTVPDDTEISVHASQYFTHRSPPTAQNLPRSALAFVSTRLDQPPDCVSDASEAELEAGASEHDPADGVARSEELYMDVDVSSTFPSPVKESVKFLSDQDQSDRHDSTSEETLVDEQAQKVKSHNPEDWKKDLRDLVVGKNTVTTAGILNINTALHSLEEMMQASSGQGLVLSLVRH